MAVAQLEKAPTLTPGTKVKITSGNCKDQTGIVSNQQPKSSYQKSRICVELPQGIKWLKPNQLEEFQEETEPENDTIEATEKLAEESEVNEEITSKSEPNGTKKSSKLCSMSITASQLLRLLA